MKQLARGGRWRWRWRQRWEVARKQSRAAGVVIHTPSWHPVGSIARTCLFAPTCLPSTNNSIAAAVLVRLPKMILNSSGWDRWATQNWPAANECTSRSCSVRHCGCGIARRAYMNAHVGLVITPAQKWPVRVCVSPPQTTTSGISKYAIYIETIHVAHPFQLRFRFTSALPVPTTAQRSAHGQWPRASPPPPPQSPRSQSSANERKSSATSRSPSAVPGRSWEVMEDRISAMFRSVRPRCSRAFLYLSIHLSIWRSGGSSQRQIMPQAAPSFGQPRPTSRLVGGSGRPYRNLCST